MTLRPDDPAAPPSAEARSLTFGDVIEILAATELVPCAPFHALSDWLAAQGEERA